MAVTFAHFCLFYKINKGIDAWLDWKDSVLLVLRMLHVSDLFIIWLDFIVACLCTLIVSM